MLLQGLVFDRNALEVSTEGRTTDATVLVFTGAVGVGTDLDSGDFIVPIWRIDDGPVYGLPWDLCQGAKQHSDEQVSRGFAPSWPNLTCANVTHAGPERSYSKTVSLTQGPHTLYAGTLQRVRPPTAMMELNLTAPVLADFSSIHNVDTRMD